MIYDLLCERSGPETRVNQPEDLVPLLSRYARKRQEHFLVVTIDGSQCVIRIHIVTIGLLNRVLIHPREVFIRAIKDNAASIILVHNHPSGSIDPSREDRDATERLAKAGTLIGIEVLDHIIIAKSKYYSFRESGEMPITGGWKSTY